MTKRAIALNLYFAGCVSLMGAQPADSLRVEALKEVTVVAVGSVKVISQKEDGSAEISRKGLEETPSFMGSNDPVALMRTMPSVATSNDLQAAINVKGYMSGANAYYADGMRIVNPLHLLGFYSAFNPAFYDRYVFRSGFISSSFPTTSGALLESNTLSEVASEAHGEGSLGLIESHLGLRLPVVRNRLSISVGGRLAYPSKIFPNLLKMGTSTLDYGFWDSNVTVAGRLSEKDFLKISAFADCDNTDVKNSRQGVKDGYFRWENIAAGISWQRSGMDLTMYWTRYRNKLRIEQAGRILDLPSGLDQLTISFNSTLPSDFYIGSDINRRRTLGQHNSSLAERNGIPPADAFEFNAGAGWKHNFGKKFTFDSGLRLSCYLTKGYATVKPQPRLSFTYRFFQNYFVSTFYQRLVRFDRLIETATGGMPSDFWTSASDVLPPDDVHSFEINIGGWIPWIGMTFSVDLYAKRILHATDYSASVMDMMSPSFDALPRIADASGWARGCSLSLMKQFGRVRGRIGYNLGKSTLHASQFGDNTYPASFDRLHDFNATLTWQPLDCLTLSASYVYATGLPYTKPKYGYMIGENLICEYFPHNSSRLPDYNRLNLSASWQHTNRHGIRQKVTLSVYNALGSKNVLFRYLKYSVANGISHESSVMNMVVPSITYIISF